MPTVEDGPESQLSAATCDTTRLQLCLYARALDLQQLHSKEERRTTRDLGTRARLAVTQLTLPQTLGRSGDTRR